LGDQRLVLEPKGLGSLCGGQSGDMPKDAEEDATRDAAQDAVTPNPPAENTDATEAPDEAGDPGAPERDLSGAGEPGMREQQP
jgi:hypothetical protein